MLAAGVYLAFESQSDVWVDPLRFHDCLYFTIVTIATVGYGDFSPVTLAGKLISAAMILFALVVLGDQVRRQGVGCVASVMIMADQRAAQADPLNLSLLPRCLQVPEDLPAHCGLGTALARERERAPRRAFPRGSRHERRFPCRLSVTRGAELQPPQAAGKPRVLAEHHVHTRLPLRRERLEQSLHFQGSCSSVSLR
eukprot:767685-Hanusia_phi.AAC.1